jgi:hypothetical protein
MTTNRASTDVFAILAIAQANWPQDPVAGSEAVWTKWSELLGSFCFEEVRAALDSMVRTHARFPSLAEILCELKAQRATGARSAAEPPDRHVPSSEARRYPPVDLGEDYVIGPYTAAFAVMNVQGWTTERLMTFIRAVDADRPETHGDQVQECRPRRPA